MLITACEEDAKSRKMKGVCAMTSSGTWITDKRLFEKNGYKITDQKGRFELMVKDFEKNGTQAEMIDWTIEQKKYRGWNLVYSDQCPWHEKSVFALSETALDSGIDLKIKKLTTPKQAKKAPSGFGTFALLRDGRLLEDHYISQTRFRNILKKELSLN
jgi:glutathionyl-hydroquinone reductase